MNHFGYMFPKPKVQSPPASDASLIALGDAMLNGPDLGEHPTLPAGYAFLAQFIAHDISFDTSAGRDISPVALDARKIVQGREVSLELESIYGKGLLSDNEQLYEADHFRLRVGFTQGIASDENREYKNDLPRYPRGHANHRQAIIGDFRNDDNLGLAQTHVAFLRFHNSVVARLIKDGIREDKLFAKARKKVVQHYQWMILHDFLPKIIEQTALEQVIKNASKRQAEKVQKQAFVPVEFSVAAFRLGHSMLRATYDWNRNFQSSSRGGTQAANFADLFRFTGLRGNLFGADHLPSDWIIDWTRFFDFTGFNGIASNPKFNWSKKIDTSVDPVLKEVRSFLRHITEPGFRSLPILDLVRGSRLGLLSGQEVARELKLVSLSLSEVVQQPHRDALLSEFQEKTPLWYYILKEAQVFHGGRYLGPVGSHIVAETIVALIKMSRFSILEKPDWKPDLGQIERHQFGMADLLVMANVVNPLGA